MMWRTNNYYVLVRLIYHAYSNGVADIIDMCKTHIIKRRSHKTILFEKAPCKKQTSLDDLQDTDVQNKRYELWVTAFGNTAATNKHYG